MHRYYEELEEYEDRKMYEEMYYAGLRQQYENDMQEQFEREMMFAMDMVYNEEIYER